MTLGDRVVVMKDGWVQQVGEPLGLYGKPRNRFVAGFIGSPAMNFVEMTVAESNGMLWVEAPGLRLRVPADRTARLGAKKGQSVTLGIRRRTCAWPRAATRRRGPAKRSSTSWNRSGPRSCST